MRRIEAVEKDLKALSESSSSKDDLQRLRAEVKKIYDGLHIGAYPNSRSCALRPLLKILMNRVPRPEVLRMGYT